MIDLRAARSEPERFREAVARKGAGDAFDELMEADGRWLELVPKVDELRARTKLKGKPTEEQLAELRRLGCDYAQGHLFSRPLAPEKVTRLLREGSFELLGNAAR